MNEESWNQRMATLEMRVKMIENYMHMPSPGVPVAKAQPQSGSISLREFLLEKRPPDDVKKTVAIGFYFEHFERMEAFNVKDLEKGFERAREKKPLNLNDKVNMAIRNGYFDQIAEKKDNKKAWHLTNSGVAFVENNFKK